MFEGVHYFTLVFSDGGERGIRTLGTHTRTAVFETATFNHSATSPQHPCNPMHDFTQPKAFIF